LDKIPEELAVWVLTLFSNWIYYEEAANLPFLTKLWCWNKVRTARKRFLILVCIPFGGSRLVCESPPRLLILLLFQVIKVVVSSDEVPQGKIRENLLAKRFAKNSISCEKSFVLIQIESW